MSSIAALLLAAVLAAVHIRAALNPSSPGPGDIFIQGKPCVISWDADTTDEWKDMGIDLMTGDNLNMVFLASVAKGLDGTNPSKNSFTYTCPSVTPHSPIYFYQFSSSSTQGKTWTGRFTITDSSNNVVAPSQSTQPSGENIPWGTGSLVSGGGSVEGAASGTHDPAAVSGGSGVYVGASSAGPVTPGPSSAIASSALPSNTSTPDTVSMPSSAHETSSTMVSVTVANGGVMTRSLSLSVFFQTWLALGLPALAFFATLEF